MLKIIYIYIYIYIYIESIKEVDKIIKTFLLKSLLQIDLKEFL